MNIKKILAAVFVGILEVGTISFSSAASYSDIAGDVNSDGQFNCDDVTAMQKYLVNYENLSDWESGDLCADGQINVFDLCMAKKGVLNGFDSKAEEIAADVNQDETVDNSDITQLQDFLIGRIKEF